MTSADHKKLDAPVHPVVPEPEEPVPPGPPFAAKFSDLAAFHQSLQTRLALTLAAFALTATAARPVAELLPSRALSNGAVPFLVYAAVFTFVAGALSILTAFLTSPRLQNETVSRLESRALTSPDETSPKLQDLFIRDITFKLKRLKRAYWMLGYTFILLMAYVTLSLIFALGEVLWPYVANLFKTYLAGYWSILTWNTVLAGRWAVISFLERHDMQLFGLYLRRPAAVFLFEAANILGIIQIIAIEKREKNVASSEAEV